MNDLFYKLVHEIILSAPAPEKTAPRLVSLILGVVDCFLFNFYRISAYDEGVEGFTICVFSWALSTIAIVHVSFTGSKG